MPTEFHYHVDDLVFLVRPGTTDIHIIREVITKDTYKAAGQIEPGDIVIDVGAHIGAFALHAASLGAKVFAFEPARVNFDQLLRNIELNGYDKDHLDYPYLRAGGKFPRYEIEAYEGGVMESEGLQTLYIRQGNFGGCSFYAKGILSEEVATITLKKLIEAYAFGGCDFLKIDCEGAEYDILKGFPHFDKVERIALEYHGDPVRQKIVELLEGKGYDVTFLANERMGHIYAEMPI